LQIRPAKISDCAAVAKLWNPVIRDSVITFNQTEKTTAKIKADLRRKARDNQPFLLSVDGETLLGFATYGRFRASNGYDETAEHTIILNGPAQRRGRGRALLAELEQHARTNGIHVLVGGVAATNLAAIAFHKSCGFLQVGHLPEVGQKFGHWHDLVLMQKIL